MLRQLALLSLVGGAAALYAQNTPAAQNAPTAPAAATPQAQAEPQQGGFKQRAESPQNGTYQIDAGTHILLNMINSVSTRQAQPGDRIYLETAFPVLSGNRIVIPQGSWVTGTITEVKRPGRVK